MINGDVPGREMYGCFSTFQMDKVSTFWAPVYVSVDDAGKINGIVCSEIQSQANKLYISTLFVAKEARGTGVSSQLLDRAIYDKAAFALEVVMVNVYSHNDHARKFYEKYGFKQCGISKYHIKFAGEYVDSIQMVIL